MMILKVCVRAQGHEVNITAINLNQFRREVRNQTFALRKSMSVSFKICARRLLIASMTISLAI